MRWLRRIIGAAAVTIAAALLQTSAEAQQSIDLGTPEGAQLTLTNDTRRLLLTNAAPGVVVAAVTVQNTGGGPCQVWHSATNATGKYYLSAGQSVTISEPERVLGPWYGALTSGSTSNAAVSITREKKK